METHEEPMRVSRINYPSSKCLECGSPFKPIRHDQVFCTTKRPRCKQVSANRELARAKVIYRELYHHVSVSGAKDRGATLSAIMRQAREWRDEDRKRKVPPPPLPERVKLERLMVSYEARKAEAVRMLKERDAALADAKGAC